MVDASMETGQRIRCTALEFSHGQMAVSIEASLPTIVKKDKVYSHGEMAESTTAPGLTVNNMVWATLLARKARNRKANGQKEKFNAGLTRMGSV